MAKTHLAIFNNRVAAQVAQMTPRHDGYALSGNIIGNLLARNINAQSIFGSQTINIGAIILLAWRGDFARFQIGDTARNGGRQIAKFLKS